MAEARTTDNGLWGGSLKHVDLAILVACLGGTLLMPACQSATVGQAVSADNKHVQALDPESLVGEWDGKMTGTDNPAAFTHFSLTIRRVRGNEVFGVMETQSLRSGLESRRFRGVLSGNVLTIGRIRFTINGGRMTGRVSEGSHGGWNFDLMKR